MSMQTVESFTISSIHPIPSPTDHTRVMLNLPEALPESPITEGSINMSTWTPDHTAAEIRTNDDVIVAREHLRHRHVDGTVLDLEARSKGVFCNIMAQPCMSDPAACS